MQPDVRVLYERVVNGYGVARRIEECIKEYILTNVYIVPAGAEGYDIWLVIRDIPLA